jgi:hypothetical protein
VRTAFSALAELAVEIDPTRDGGAGEPVGATLPHWLRVGERFQSWATRPGLRAGLRAHLHGLPADQAAWVTARSRETTTHFAWCLRDEPTEPFTFWLHEYKPQTDWRPGYADSVHNHRYHFCTTILRGGYLHERYQVRLDRAGTSVTSAELARSSSCGAGAAGTLLAHEFHRIPQAADDTLTFLVKSRPVRPWSLSYDPVTGISRQHVPVETRLGDLIDRL